MRSKRRNKGRVVKQRRKGLKGRHITAQGAALGKKANHNRRVLKLRKKGLKGRYLTAQVETLGKMLTHNYKSALV